MDRVGKDTQVELIKQNLSNRTFHTFHYSKPPKGKPDFQKKYSEKLYQEMFDLIYQNPRLNFIFNRSHLGEAVYANKYRNYSGEYVWNLEQIYMKSDNQYLIVLLNTDLKVLQQREDGDSLSQNINDLEFELEQFTSAYKKSKIKNKILIDVKDLSIEQVNQKIIKFLNK